MDWHEIAKWLWGLLVPAGWWIFNRQDKRMDALEAQMSDKAEKDEVNRQRDTQAKIFDQLTELRQDVNDKHAELLKAIYESRK